jgi:hypothetical protein
MIWKALRAHVAGLLYVNHIEAHGTALFEQACKLDLVRIVAKHRDSRYLPDERSTWLKIKNPNYTQSEGRHELFKLHGVNQFPQIKIEPSASQGGSANARLNGPPSRCVDGFWSSLVSVCGCRMPARYQQDTRYWARV